MFTSVDEGTESSTCNRFLHIIGNGMQLIHHDEVCKLKHKLKLFKMFIYLHINFKVPVLNTLLNDSMKNHAFQGT